MSTILVAAGMLGVVVPAVAQGSEVSVEIRAGSCDEPGQTIEKLSGVPRPGNGSMGASDAIPAASSFSSVSLALDALTAADHIILVPFEQGANKITQAGSLMVQATDELENLRAERGI